MPANSAVPSAVILIFAAAALLSVVTILNVPFVPTVKTAVSSVEPVIVITLPSILISSTVKVVNVPRLVIFDCAAPVTVAAVPVQLPVKSPTKPPAANLPEVELKDKLELVFNARSPVAAVANVTKQVLSLDSFAIVIAVAVPPPPPPPPPPPLVNDTHCPPFRPSKSEPVYFIVPSVVPLVVPIKIAPVVCKLSLGEVVPIPILSFKVSILIEVVPYVTLPINLLSLLTINKSELSSPIIKSLLIPLGKET